MRKREFSVGIIGARVFSHARVKSFYNYSFYNSVGDCKTGEAGGKWWIKDDQGSMESS